MSQYVVVELRASTRWRYELDESITRAKVDLYRSRAVAESAANALNAGRAIVDPHAVIGCRVIAR